MPTAMSSIYTEGVYKQTYKYVVQHYYYYH